MELLCSHSERCADCAMSQPLKKSPTGSSVSGVLLSRLFIRFS